MYYAPWRFLKGKQCEALMKEGKMKYVNHLMKPYLLNSDDSKPVAKAATNIYLSISINFPSKLLKKYNTLSLEIFVYILIMIRHSLYFECIPHLGT